MLVGDLVLRVEGRGPLRLGPRSAPAAFPGDVPAAADTPPTPVTDLNVMTRRGRVRSRVNRRRLDRPRTLIAKNATVILSLSADLRLVHPGGDERLDQYDAALIGNPSGARLVLVPNSAAVVFVIAFEAPAISTPS